MNPSRRFAVVFFAAACATLPCLSAHASQSAAPVALVYRITGEATLVTPASDRRPLRRFDRLSRGARIEVAAGSCLALGFANGRRYELGERSRVTIGEADLAARSGPVRTLALVPSLPRLAPIAAGEEPGLRAGAVRIRGEKMVYPGRPGAPAEARDGLDPALYEALEAGEALRLQGNVAMESQDLMTAEDLYRRAKALYEKVSPESLEMARILKNLGHVAAFRGDPETADFHLQRALALQEKLDPYGEGVAGVLQSLGLQALARGDLEKAEDDLRRAVSLYEQRKPESESLATSLQNLGAILIEGGKCAAARDILQRSLALRQKSPADELPIARSLQALGFHSYRCGDLSSAECYHRKALGIRERLDFGGINHATLLYDLGEVLRSEGRPEEAVELFCQDSDLFEERWDRPGELSVYDEKHFTGCAAARLETGEAAEAFRLLERGRARTFLKQLAGRELSTAAGLPDEIAGKRKQLAHDLDSAQAALARLGPAADAAETGRLFDRLRDLRDQRQSLDEQIRRDALRSASLRSPEYLDLAGTRRALDPGTLLLSYLVEEEKSYLFVVQSADVPGPGLTVFPIPAGRQALQDSVRSLRNLFQNSASDPARLKIQAAELYDLLLGPAESQIAPARRILISAHGPLHTLPFAALIHQGQYLAEWKPLHFILSATVYAEIKKTRRPSAGFADAELVAFGDPLYPVLPKDPESTPAALREVLASVRRGLSLEPIPATRAEVEEIAALFPHTRVYMGKEASEERARALPPHARIVHFATHGLLDERFPLSSALALTVPERQAEGQENGLLQAWEIIQDVRLDADLVTLSACDTALGQEAGGEGLIGLTRAFQYAGARSVLATSWSISDVSTAAFMKRFYSALREGATKDEALRAAQAGLIHSTAFSHPYYWAAFQLVGDWK